MDKIARSPHNDRRDLFLKTAEQMRVHEAVIEKDFWVSWVLDALFTSKQWQDKMIFKGGTSLSKAFHIINRFSEDIDLILDWRLLGLTSDEPWEARSNTSQDKFCKDVNEKAAAYIAAEFVPSFRKVLEEKLQAAVSVEPHGEIVSITYPKTFSIDYVLPEIRLEIGPLAAWVPHGIFEITPYTAEYYPQFFEKNSAKAVTILAERTFWEKATILHQQAMMEKISPRYSRHYYDLAQMTRNEVKQRALADLALLKEVITFKQQFYKQSKARYELAIPGSFKLIPSDDCLRVLRDDYNKMKEMIFGVPPSFEAIVETLKTLEDEINLLAYRSGDFV